MTAAPDAPPAPADALPPLRWWAPLVVVLVGLVAWWPSLGGELVYDDLLLVARNPHITGWQHAGEAFSTGYWDFLGPMDAQRVGYFRPLTRLALTLGWSLGDGAPGPFHALSIAFHLLASLAAFLVARRILRSGVAALFAGLLFCLHPLQVESVAWISAVNDPMFGAFALLSVHAHLRWRDGGARGVPLLPAAWLLLALLSKEIALATPVLLLVLDLARGEGTLVARLRPLVRGYAPLAVVGAVYYAWRVAVFGDLAAGLDRTTTDFGITAGRQVTLRWEMLGGWLRLLVWPSDLSLFRPVRPDIRFGDPAMLLDVLAIVVTAALAVWLGRRRERRLLAALLVVPAALLPALGRLESLGQFPLSDRFAYVAVAGFAALVAGAAVRALPARVAPVALALVALPLGARTWAQIDVWRNEERLYRHLIEREPRGIYARWGLGRVLLGKFQATDPPDPAILDEAITTFEGAQDLLEESLRGAPDVFATNEDFLQTHLGVAWSYFFHAKIDGFEDYSTPIALFEIAAEKVPFDERSWIGIATCRHHAGDLDGAEQGFKEALKRNPRSPEAHRNYGLLLLDMRDLKRARHHFEQSLAERPGNLRDLVDIARCWHDDGWPQEAEKVALQAHALHPDSVEPLRVLATCEVTKGDDGAALGWLDQALALDATDGDAWLLKGKVLLKMGESAEAIVALRSACDHDPTSFEAHSTLGLLMLQSGVRDGVRPYLDRAFRIGWREPARMALVRENLAALVGEDAVALLELSRVDRARGDLSGAWLLLELALQVDPDYPTALLERSVQLRALGRPDEAIPPLLELLEAHAESFDLALELGLVLRDAGRLDEALLHLNRALELLPPQAPPAIRGQIDLLIQELLDALQPPPAGDPPSD